MTKQSKTDWKRIDSLRDEEIDYAGNPELDREFFAEAVLWPGLKQQISLRLDSEVLSFFRTQGKGYQTTIQAVLRRYVELQKRFGRRAVSAPPPHSTGSPSRDRARTSLRRRG